MREFILLASRARTSPDFDLFNLKEAGRMDLVCRAVSSAFFTSDNLRTDTILNVVLNGPDYPPKIITFSGNSLRNIYPDEISIAGYILQALKKGKNLKLNEQIDVTDGVKISKKSFEAQVKEKSSDKKLIYLNDKGEDIRDIELKDDFVFILGDNLGLPKKTEKFLDRLNAKKVKLGSVSLFSSHAIILVHNEFDRTV